MRWNLYIGGSWAGAFPTYREAMDRIEVARQYEGDDVTFVIRKAV